MIDTFLVHWRTMCYGGMIAFFVISVIKLMGKFREQKSPNARFVLVVSAITMGLLAVKNVVRFLLDTMLVAFPDVPSTPLHASPHIMEMMAVPLLGVALCAIARMKPTSIIENVAVQLPLVVALIFYILTGMELVMVMSLTYTILYAAAVVVYVHIGVHRYHKLLNDTYANTSQRGITWVLITLYILVGLMVLWAVLTFVFPGVLSDCIYFPLSLIPWIFYYRRVLRQDFNVSAMTADSTSGVVTEGGSILRTWQDPRFGDAINRYCRDKDNFTNTDLNIVEVARAVGSNRTYVSLWCKEQGMNFNSYINSIRLEHATPLLVAGHSINDIVLKSGFSNVRSFRLVFAQHYNCTPSEYRARKQA